MKNIKKEKGSVIIEATIVFPVVFFTLFMFFFIAQLLYEETRLESVAQQYAVIGAQMVADPVYEEIYTGQGQYKEFTVGKGTTKIQPYRYIFGGDFDYIANKIEDEIAKDLNGDSLQIFGHATNAVSDPINAGVENMIFFRTFVVEITQEYEFPISFDFIGVSNKKVITARAEVAVSDVDEFIRNVDMANDILEEVSGSEAEDWVKKAIEFVQKYFNNSSIDNSDLEV